METMTEEDHGWYVMRYFYKGEELIRMEAVSKENWEEPPRQMVVN